MHALPGTGRLYARAKRLGNTWATLGSWAGSSLVLNASGPARAMQPIARVRLTRSREYAPCSRYSEYPQVPLAPPQRFT